MSETVKTRKTPSKAVKEIQGCIKRIDLLYEKLTDNPSKQSGLLIERCGLVKTLIGLESEAEVERLTAENERLKAELQTALTAKPADRVAVALAKYDQEKARKNGGTQ